jgi:hypothetical protein
MNENRQLFKPITDSTRLFRGLKEQVNEALAPVANLFSRLDQLTQPSTEQWQMIEERTRNIFSNVLNTLLTGLEALPDRVQNDLEVLGSNGWYLDLEMTIPLLSEVANLFNSEEIENGDNILCAYYDERLDDMKRIIENQYPDRWPILEAAFNAHSRGDYALSIPIFLIQADGICQVVTGGLQLYSRRDHVPVTANYVQNLPQNDRLLLSTLYPLSIPLPISASQAERANLPGALNRHAILHGESVDYATLVNSFKAISLLIYVATVLTDANNP